MDTKILFVDDDANILAGFQRQLRRYFTVVTAHGAEEALEKIRLGEIFAVVISDFRMPGMNGVEFLAEVRSRSPQSIRMMLTGHADLETTINAVNEGNIFRFLTKPATTIALRKAIEAGLEQYRLVRSEKEILEKTLTGSVKILSDILGLVSPAAFGRASRVRRLARQIGERLEAPDLWRMEIAAMLSQIGCVTLPGTILDKIYLEQALSNDEHDLFKEHPEIGCEIISNIPRLKEVAEIVALQEKHFNGDGFPQDPREGEALPLGARILHVALHYDNLTVAGHSAQHALKEIKKRPHWYDTKVVAALEAIVKAETFYEMRTVNVADIQPNMILAEDVVANNNVLVLARGQEVTPSLKQRLLNFAKTTSIPKTVDVMAPIRKPDKGHGEVPAGAPEQPEKSEKVG